MGTCCAIETDSKALAWETCNSAADRDANSPSVGSRCKSPQPDMPNGSQYATSQDGQGQVVVSNVIWPGVGVSIGINPPKCFGQEALMSGTMDTTNSTSLHMLSTGSTPEEGRISGSDQTLSFGSLAGTLSDTLPKLAEMHQENGSSVSGSLGIGRMPSRRVVFADEIKPEKDKTVMDPNVEQQPLTHAVHNFSDGASYEGQWLGSKRHGYGVQKWPDGSSYEGQWINDEACGRGVLRSVKNGAVYNVHTRRPGPLASREQLPPASERLQTPTSAS